MKQELVLLRILSLLLFIPLVVHAQVGIGTVSPESSAILDVSSISQGVLVPRMTTAQRAAIVTSPTSQGLLVYDTDEDAFYSFDGVAWEKMISQSNINDYTGWGDYVDGNYTSGSPLALAAATKITLPNNAATVRDSQKPVDVTTFYDSSTSTITGRDGDGINIVIEFKARPTTNTATTRLTVAIDIGGAVGEIYTRDFLLGKGTGVEHYYLSSFNAYTLNTWEANGGTVKIVSTAAAEVYDIRYIITRTHKAR
ncbi:hypothetical protein [Croceiramulus getboli]|nr:hypothetical protein P8624_06785 [Flavobacteriaceae bacterium YJPT1-3]